MPGGRQRRYPGAPGVENLKVLEVVTQAAENLRALVNEMPSIPQKDIKRRELSSFTSRFHSLRLNNYFHCETYHMRWQQCNRTVLWLAQSRCRLSHDEHQLNGHKPRGLFRNRVYNPPDRALHQHPRPHLSLLQSFPRPQSFQLNLLFLQNLRSLLHIPT